MVQNWQIDRKLSRGGLRPCLDKHGPACAFRALFQASGNRLDASLPIPHLRRFARRAHRRNRAAVRLGAPHARPRRRAVHRSARSLWPDPGGGRPGFAGVQGRREAARRMGDQDRRQGAPPPRRHRECRPADRRGRGLYRFNRGAGSGRRIADAGVRRSGISGGNPAQVPLPRSAARAAARTTSSSAGRSSTRSAAA